MTQQKYEDWKLVKKFKDPIEVWHTVGPYFLTCCKYEGIFIFSTSLEKAIANVRIVKDRLNHPHTHVK